MDEHSDVLCYGNVQIAWLFVVGRGIKLGLVGTHGKVGPGFGLAGPPLRARNQALLGPTLSLHDSATLHCLPRRTVAGTDVPELNAHGIAPGSEPSAPTEKPQRPSRLRGPIQDGLEVHGPEMPVG